MKWRCKSCGFETMLLPELRGKKVYCPKCGAIGEVPGGVVERSGKLKKVAERHPLHQTEQKDSTKTTRKNLLIALLILAVGVVVLLFLLLVMD